MLVGYFPFLILCISNILKQAFWLLVAFFSLALSTIFNSFYLFLSLRFLLCSFFLLSSFLFLFLVLSFLFPINKSLKFQDKNWEWSRMLRVMMCTKKKIRLSGTKEWIICPLIIKMWWWGWRDGGGPSDLVTGAAWQKEMFSCIVTRMKEKTKQIFLV